MPEPADDRWISDALMEAILGDEPSSTPADMPTSGAAASSTEPVGPYGTNAPTPPATTPPPVGAASAEPDLAAPARRIGGPTYRPFDAGPADEAPATQPAVEAPVPEVVAPEPEPEPTPGAVEASIPEAAPAQAEVAATPIEVDTPLAAESAAPAGAVRAGDPVPEPPDIAQAPPVERPTTSDVTSAVMPDTTDDERPTIGDLAEGELETPVDDEPSVLRAITEWIAVFAGAILVALILRAFVVQSFYIPSESMESTLVEQDRVLVNKLSYRLHDVNRGDVIVFRRDPNTPGDTDDLIKRVIALPGETIELRDGEVYIDEQLLDEPYLDSDVVIDDFPATTVPEGEVFVMGDNRDQSFDSRWIGTIPRDRIVGRAFVLFWPLNRVDAL